MINILLTRSFKNNINFIESYRHNNFNFINCPLLEQCDLKIDLKFYKKFEHIIITSHYAASILEFNKYNFKIWVIGAKSASLLKSKNYKIVYVANNIQELLSNIPYNIMDKMIYLSGNVITKSLPRKIKRVIIYKTYYTKFLREEYIELFNRKKIDYILICSEYTAKLLIKLLKQFAFDFSLQNITVITISQKVSEQCRDYFGKILNVNNNSIMEMMKLLEKDLNGSTKTR